MSNIPVGITRTDVFTAISSLDKDEPHNFGPSTGYDLLEGGRRYPPKAVVGLAARRILGHPLGPYDFQGGERSHAFRVLRDLGFVILRKEAEGTSGQDWTEDEVRAVVEDYFNMLRLERDGVPYNKSAHNAALRERIPARSKGSIEFKHANISAVLESENYPYIQGYKPRRNYQRDILVDVVLEYLGTGEGELPEIERTTEVVPQTHKVATDFSNSEVPVPESVGEGDGPVSLRPPRRARKKDFVAQDAANRSLGRAGEEFVLQWEQWKLQHGGRDDLAALVEWVSVRSGDGLGYDIRSFDVASGHEIFIEVKTTNLGQQFPFYLSQNELEASVEIGEQYRLYRVFNFSTKPQFYQVRGSLRAAFRLRPHTYEARR